MKTILIGLSTALLTGLAIGIQATLSSRSGEIIGSVRTGLLTNFLGGSIAGIIILILIFISGTENWKIPSKALIMVSSAGLLGILIITGVSFSLQRVGVTAGLAIIIMGQMILSVIIDTKGIGGAEPITLSFSRLAGLLLLGVSIYLLLPKE